MDKDKEIFTESDSRKKTGSPKIFTTKIVFIYLLVGVVWILLSDTILLGLFPDPELYSVLQTAKGWLYVGITALLLSALIHQELARREKINKELERLIKDREELLHELNHRVRNSLQVTLSLFNLQIFEVEDDEAAFKVLNKTRNRLQTITSCLDNLYNSDSFSEIELKSYLEKLAADAISAMKNTHGDFHYTCSCSTDILVPLETAVPLGLIVNELIENSITHAYKSTGANNKEKSVNLLLKSSDDGFTVVVSDKGSGFSLSNGNGGRVGFTLIESLVRQIGGSYYIEKSREDISGPMGTDSVGAGAADEGSAGAGAGAAVRIEVPYT